VRSIDDVFELSWGKDFPRAVQLETSSLCNSRCVFCPYERVSYVFPVRVMKDFLFDKILGELVEFQPLFVALYMNNEPLTDVKIFDRLRKVRLGLPDAYIDFSTNAGLLSGEKAVLLAESGVDEVKVNFPSVVKREYECLTGLSYDGVLRNVLNFSEVASERGFGGLFRVIMVGSEHPLRDRFFWRSHGVKSKVYRKISRGGAVDTGFDGYDVVEGCRFSREKNWLHVLSGGEVVLCCMDWYRQEKLGDLNYSSVFDVWNGEKYGEVRKRVARSDDSGFICNRCEWAVSGK
jgi:hypothetical protein